MEKGLEIKEKVTYYSYEKDEITLDVRVFSVPKQDVQFTVGDRVTGRTIYLDPKGLDALIELALAAKGEISGKVQQ